jgi:glyoxylase-like metal-dependent hydrolase (beta-lactamase superfamily II)
MRYIIKGLLLSILLVFTGNTFATSYAPSSVKMELKQVSKHVWYVQGEAGIATDNEGFISNAGVVITNEGVVIFDALGTPSLAHKLLQEIRKVTDKPIKRVIVSHYHADHIYGLQVFKEEGAEIYAPGGATDYLVSPASKERLEERRFSLSPWVNEQTRLVPPDHYLDKGFSFMMGNVKMTVSVVGAAHSDGDLTLYVEGDRVLFSGDIIFEGRVAFLGDADTRHWLETLQQMETAGLAALVPGHGPVADEPNQSITQTRRYLSFLRKTMKAAVDELQSFDEVYAATDWSEFENLPAFKEANRRNAYQVFLSIEREALSAN